MRDPVEFPCRGQGAPEGLFDNDTRMLGQHHGAKPSNHRFEERRRNSQIVRWPPRAAQRLIDRGECIAVFVIPAHILEQGEKMLQRALVIDSCRFPDAVQYTLVQSFRTPLWEGDARSEEHTS